MTKKDHPGFGWSSKRNGINYFFFTVVFAGETAGETVLTGSAVFVAEVVAGAFTFFILCDLCLAIDADVTSLVEDIVSVFTCVFGASCLVTVVVAFCGCDFAVAFCAVTNVEALTANTNAVAIIRTFFILFFVF
jgi:hypothetical protein